MKFTANTIKTLFRKYWVALALGVVLLIAAYFRFHNLFSQGGVWHSDEIMFLEIARSFRSAFIFLGGFLGGEYAGSIRDEGIKFFAGGFRTFTAARPGYIFLISLPVLIFGIHDYIPQITNVILSLASVYLVFKTARKITGSNVAGLISALILSLSGYSIFYARSGIAQVSSSFFLILGALFYLYSLDSSDGRHRRYLKFAAFVFGFLLTTHYNAIIFVAAIGLFEFFYSLRQRMFKRIPVFLGYLAIFPLFFQAVTLAEVVLFKKLGLHYAYLTYFGEIITQVKDAAFNWIPPVNVRWQYLQFLYFYDGILITVLFLLAPLLFFYKKWRQNKMLFFVFITVYIPLIILSLIPLKTMYNFTIFLPLISVITAICVFAIAERLRLLRQAVILFFIVIFLVIGLKNAVIFSNFKSPYQAAADFFASQGKISSWCGNSIGPLEFYLNDYTITMYPILADCLAKSQYIILDWQNGEPESDEAWRSFAREHEPTAAFEQPYYAFLCSRFKKFGDEATCKTNTSLRIYKNF